MCKTCKFDNVRIYYNVFELKHTNSNCASQRRKEVINLEFKVTAVKVGKLECRPIQKLKLVQKEKRDQNVEKKVHLQNLTKALT